MSNDVRIYGCFPKPKGANEQKSSGKNDILYTFQLENLRTGTALSHRFLICKLLSFLWQFLNSALHSKHQNKYLFTNSLLWFWRMSLLMLCVLSLRRMERTQLYDVSPVSYKCTVYTYLVCIASEFYRVLLRQPHFRKLSSRRFLFLEPIL